LSAHGWPTGPIGLPKADRTYSSTVAVLREPAYVQ